MVHKIKYLFFLILMLAVTACGNPSTASADEACSIVKNIDANFETDWKNLFEEDQKMTQPFTDLGNAIVAASKSDPENEELQGVKKSMSKLTSSTLSAQSNYTSQDPSDVLKFMKDLSAATKEYNKIKAWCESRSSSSNDKN
jgi:hypothetical protein